jgi:prepilin-type N-terminal cleavage/methylation domain-containing protein
MGKSNHGFTLAEMLITVAVLALVVLLVTRVVNSAATITTLGNKRIDSDSQARQAFDRMAVDFNKILKRNDISFWVKTLNNTEVGNDQIAFFSSVPGNNTQVSTTANSRISLVAYRVNALNSSASYNKLERMVKGLGLNGASTTQIPLLFLDSPTAPTTTISLNWAAAVSSTLTDSNSPYGLLGRDAFRFEYYFLLPTGALSAGPWTGASASDMTQVSNPTVAGTPAFKDLPAIVVAIATIDAKSRGLLTTAQMETLAGTNGKTSPFVDFVSGWTPGQLVATWQNALTTNVQIAAMPRAATQGIRFYEHYFYFPPGSP